MSARNKCPKPSARIIHAHSENCRAVQYVADGTWDTPWCGLPEKSVWLSKVGDKRGNRTPWLVLRCNCTYCPGRKIVKADVLSFCEPETD